MLLKDFMEKLNKEINKNPELLDCAIVHDSEDNDIFYAYDLKIIKGNHTAQDYFKTDSNKINAIAFRMKY